MCIFKSKSSAVTNTTAAVDSQIAQQQATINQLIEQGKTDREQAKKDQEALLTSLTASSQAQLSELQKQNTSLTQQITSAQEQATATQAGLLKQFQDFTAQQAAEASKAMAATGQGVKKPNYKNALDKNKALESGGLSSTNLTGSGGVPVTSLTLGAPALLGA